MRIAAARRWIGLGLVVALAACGGGSGGGSGEDGITVYEVRNSPLSVADVVLLTLRYQFPYPDVGNYSVPYPVRLEPGEWYRVTPPPGSILHVIALDWSDGGYYGNVLGGPRYEATGGAIGLEVTR